MSIEPENFNKLMTDPDFKDMVNGLIGYGMTMVIGLFCIVIPFILTEVDYRFRIMEIVIGFFVIYKNIKWCKKRFGRVL